MATDGYVNMLQQELNTLLKYTDTELITRPAWGEINFEDARLDVEAALSIAKDLAGLPLQELTDGTAQQIQGVIPAVAQLFERIDQFSLTAGGDPADNRRQICEELHNVVEQLRDTSSPSIPYLAYKRGDIADNIAKLDEGIAQSQTAFSDAESWISQKKETIEQIESAARTAAASAGAGTFTDEFNAEAESLQGRSTKWLIAAAVFAGTTIAAALLFYFWPEVSSEAGPWETLRNIASKAAIIVVLFTGTVWCGRIYRALVHQAAVNRHRALSLKTFQAFVEATDDPYVKDAVLMAATRTVFGNVPTGLVEHGDSQNAGVNFVEFGRSGAEIAADKVVDGS